MADTLTLLALFSEVDPSVIAIDKLHEMGVADEKLTVISGIPFSQQVLGRPNLRTIIPRLAMGGAMIGLVAALFLIFGIPGLYPLTVGGQPVFPFPPFLKIGFE